MVVSNKKKAIIVCGLALLLLIGSAAGALLLLKKNDTSEGTNVAALQTELNDAIKQSTSGQCPAAVNALESLLSKTAAAPEIDAEAKLRLGQCYIQLLRYQDAASRLDQARNQYSTLGDTGKQALANSLYEQASAEASNAATSTDTTKSTEPKPSAPPEW